MAVRLYLFSGVCVRPGASSEVVRRLCSTGRSCMQTWHRHRYRKRARAVSDQAMESYLREDVSCGVPTCSTCGPTLPHLPKTASHLVIPEAQILECYLDVFQLPELHSIVYLTSVVKQVGWLASPANQIVRYGAQSSLSTRMQVLAHGNLRKGTKIRELYQDVRRQCFLFDDEHCIWTAGKSAER